MLASYSNTSSSMKSCSSSSCVYIPAHMAKKNSMVLLIESIKTRTFYKFERRKRAYSIYHHIIMLRAVSYSSLRLVPRARTPPPWATATRAGQRGRGCTVSSTRRLMWTCFLSARVCVTTTINNTSTPAVSYDMWASVPDSRLAMISVILCAKFMNDHRATYNSSY